MTLRMSKSTFVVRIMPKALDLVAHELVRANTAFSEELYVVKPTENALRELVRESSVKCPVLRDRIDDEREVVMCPRCKMRYHVECVRLALQSGLEKCLRPDCEYNLAGMLAGKV